MSDADFKTTADRLLSRARELLSTWLPGGRVKGREFICGSLRGETGESLSINIETGKWADFASGEKGGDLISLYAAINGIKQIDALKTLSNEVGVSTGTILPAPRAAPVNDIIAPPPGTPTPSFLHSRHGAPTEIYTYRDSAGDVINYICRYDPEDGKKQFVPFSFTKQNKWIMRSWPAPRPLYNLHKMTEHPDRAVLIVEGEKAADAAELLVGSTYVVTTWSGGCKAFDKTDWSPIAGRKILLWPDADAPGREAMADLIKQQYQHHPEIKVLKTDMWEPGTDAADMGIDSKAFFKWARENHVQVKPSPLTRTATDMKTIEPRISKDVTSTSAPLVSLQASIDRLHLAQTKNGTPVCNLDNVLRVLEGFSGFKDLVWVDEFHFKIFTKWNTGQIREWSESDDIRMTAILQRELAMQRITPNVVSQAIADFASRHVRNEPRDWMDSLAWDHLARIDNFFIDCLGCDDNEYTRSVSKNFWLGLVARALRPGCKLDNMVILEGKQGTYKSSALSLIGGSWYIEANESVTSKDFYLLLHGKLLVEIAELDSFNKAEVNTIKKVISTAKDRYRAPYDRRPKDYPRQSVFVGTTNDEDYLRDHTGARRFWPVKTGAIDLEMIRQHREQLFAEAVARVKAGELWHQVPTELARAEQESRRQVDVWEEIIQNWMVGRGEFTLEDVYVGCLKGDIARLDRMTQVRISKVLRSLGLKNRVTREGAKTRRLWSRVGELIQQVLRTPTENDGVLRTAQGVRVPEGVDRVRNFAPGADNSHLDD